MTKGDISPRGIYHQEGYITRWIYHQWGYITRREGYIIRWDISPVGIYHQGGYVTMGEISPRGIYHHGDISPGEICHHGGNITTRDISPRGYIAKGDTSLRDISPGGDDSWLYQSSYLASVYTKDGLLIWDIKTLRPEVIMQGNLIAVAYTLCIYWNQFFLGGICKQE